MIIETRFVGLPRHFAWQNTEFIIAAMIQALREMAGHVIRPARVTFTLAHTSELLEFERFFGCPVEFSAPADQFGFSNETLALPLVTEDRHLLDTLQPICDEAAKEPNTAHGTLRNLVENEVQKLLPHGRANKQRAAKTLGLSERTLSQGWLNKTQATKASRSNTSSSRAFQIGWLLGYEGPTSFNYAFARWTGRSASEARKEKQRPQV
jgi:AraC-like DNA-binding protein